MSILSEDSDLLILIVMFAKGFTFATINLNANINPQEIQIYEIIGYYNSA